jgi:multicomponent Na+:H+ antiporter subunit F
VTTFLLGAAAVLVLNVAVVLWRVARGPHLSDRLAGLLLMGTTGAMVLAVLAQALGEPGLRDAALGVVALAALMVVVRATQVRRAQPPGGSAPRDERPEEVARAD